MKKNVLLMTMLLVVACSSLPPLVSLESGGSDPQMVTIYKDPT